MCGVAGCYGVAWRAEEELDAWVESMTSALKHRGPDGAGRWVDGESGIGLGHSRLSILELSRLGAQPMHSYCGRYAISYNGEVYNHQELRKDLGGYSFKSDSDTETILAAISAWGLEAALERFIGMFAIALWDKKERSLTLVRDRMGIKPLFYGRVGNKGWVFGSELKALKAHPDYEASIDRHSLALYFRHNYVPAPYCIHKKTWKVEPGQLVVFRDGEISKRKWWNIDKVWRSGFDAPLQMSDSEAVDALEKLISDSVRRRMLSDVPLGAFLSGGIDSSTVVALMQAQAMQPIKTYSIGFHEKEYNEAQHAKAVAACLGTDHTELYVTQQDLLDVVPMIPEFWDEPFADSSQIPTYILSKLTREHVTVSLSGDGGDELFSGYQRYFCTSNWDRIAAIPLSVRICLKKIFSLIPHSAFEVFGQMGPKLKWRLDLLGMRGFQEFYRFQLSHFKHPENLVLGGWEYPTALTDSRPMLPDRLAHMALKDLQMYLPDDILTKVDRASMAVALEARVPLLDHNVVEFAAKVPKHMKVRGGKGKYLLRKVLHRYVPESLVERPKMGFGAPIGQWMRYELRDWCESLLDEGSIRGQGYLNASVVRRMWKQYLNGNDGWQYYLWDVLMYQAWLEREGTAC